MGKARLPGSRLAVADVQRLVTLHGEGYGVPELAIRFGKCEQWVRTQVASAAAANSSTRPTTVAMMAPASL